ncbi:hypothetical protein ABID21_003575 [Pseudorhizobium tarimense]|uniref:Uncharacterized protein n=1 Tax=Pseudorhizobium tarimense TaxID=1079109 RepID=A0ABV2HA70_9HYPH|nr:hypothetical protein [Pseudorhizobium tarimense]MCJ8520547.1 hypothetical protein [Pseudorhizobium tarimense]
MAQDLAAAGEPPGGFTCRKSLWCVAKTKEGVKPASVEDSRITGLGCDLAGLLVTWRARFEECRSGALLVSGNALRKTGALEISLGGSTNPSRWNANAAIAGARRPWTEHRLYDWRSDRAEERSLCR